VPLLCAGDPLADLAPLCWWNGTSLGSPSRLLIYHADRAAAGLATSVPGSARVIAVAADIGCGAPP